MEYKKVPQEIFNKVNENVKALEKLFPSVVKDGEVDFIALKEALGQFEEVGKEKYELTWVGKQNAKKEADNDVLGRTLKFVPEDSKDVDTTENIYIEGDNLEVLKMLRQNYYNSVKIIYIDPPYNTGNDYIYNDNFKMSEEESKELEGETADSERLIINQKSGNRFHANWLNMMYSRLIVAKDLLRDDGAIFISIGVDEQTNLKKVCDDIFGESNFVECLIWNKRIPKNDKGIGSIHEYVLVYRKNNNDLKFNMLKEGLDEVYELVEGFKRSKLPIPEAEDLLKKFYRKKDYDRGITLYNALDDNYRIWGKINLSWPNADTFGPRYDVLHPITKVPVNVPDRGWRWTKETFDSKLDYENNKLRFDGSSICGDIWFAKDENTQPSSVKYLDDVNEMLLRSILSFKSDGGIEVEKIFDGKSYFSYPKPTSLVKTLLGSVECEKGDIVLDFFSGSGTTAHAVLLLNDEDKIKRNYIMVQIKEELETNTAGYNAGYRNICEVAKERIKRVDSSLEHQAGFKVFEISDTNIRWTHEALATGQIKADEAELTDKDQLDFMPGFTDVDVVYEIMLRQRDIPLSSKVERLTDIGDRTFIFADSYVVCLEETVTEELVEKLAALEPLPIKFILRDSAFEDDISLKDETFRRLQLLIARNTGEEKKTYTVEFL